MKIEVPCRHTVEIGRLFRDIGAEVRFVGGCVRDSIKGQPVKDIDLATSATPDTVMAAAEASGYRVIPTGLQHGTVTVCIGGEGYEITTLRADIETDGRHAKVEFVTDYRTDAARRDFTFNAMSAELDGTVHDYFGGIDDLRDACVRFVGSPDDRICEDYLRILRFYRFRARYGGNEPPEYVERVGRHAPGLRRISGERIWSELSRILLAPDAGRNLADMERTGVLAASGLSVADPDSYRGVLDANALAHGHAGLLLGLVAEDAKALDVALERWRVSTLDRERAELALDVRETFLNARSTGASAVYDWHYWLNRAIDGEPLEDMRGTLDLLGLRKLATELPMQIPVFPVKGADLIEQGMKPGREMGDVLRSLKEAWKASGYSLNRDDLLGATTAVPNTGGFKP